VKLTQIPLQIPAEIPVDKSSDRARRSGREKKRRKIRVYKLEEGEEEDDRVQQLRAQVHVQDVYKLKKKREMDQKEREEREMDKIRQARMRFIKISKVHIFRNARSLPKMPQEIEFKPLLPSLKFSVKPTVNDKKLTKTKSVQKLISEAQSNIQLFKMRKKHCKTSQASLKPSRSIELFKYRQKNTNIQTSKLPLINLKDTYQNITPQPGVSLIQKLKNGSESVISNIDGHLSHYNSQFERTPYPSHKLGLSISPSKTPKYMNSFPLPRMKY
jgi:hypothetical protein